MKQASALKFKNRRKRKKHKKHRDEEKDKSDKPEKPPKSYKVKLDWNEMERIAALELRHLIQKEGDA
jgi:hypothetical protein